MAGGRPSKYKKEYNEQVYKLCLLGADDKQLADFFGVTERTINRWKKSEEEFCQSLKEGKTVADAEIAHSLYNKAKGHTKVVNKAFKVKHIEYNNGKRVSEHEEIVHAQEEMYVPPDTTAIIFWTKNRNPDKWRDKKEVDMAVTELPEIVIKRGNKE